MMRNRFPASRSARVNDTGLSRGRPERYLSKLLCWLDSDSNAAGTVVTWVDKTGRGNSPTALTGTPTATAAQIKGHSSVLYDGVDDSHKKVVTFAQPFQFLMVCKITAQGGNNDTPLAFNAGGNVFLLVDNTPRSILLAGSSITYTNVVANGAYAIVEGVLNSTTSTLIELPLGGAPVTRATGDAGSTGAITITLGTLLDATHCATIAITRFMVASPVLTTPMLDRARNHLKAAYF
jgi:hypothetical protein